MRAAKLDNIGHISVEEVPFDKTPEAGQAVIQIKAVGICGTDLHIFEQGRSDVQLPRIMGHELSGVVTAVGKMVSNIKPGDRVVMDPVISCGTCRTCKSGHTNVCEQVQCLGVQTDGGFCDYLLAEADKLYVFPDHISFEQAAMAEPFSVAVNIILRTQIQPKDRVVVIGAGTIGLCLIQALKGLNIQVLAADIEEQKLKIARSFGADKVVNTGKADLKEAVESFYPGGADVVIDAVGASSLTRLAVQLAAPCGRIGVIAFDDKSMELPPVEITKKELTLVGSRMNRNCFPKVLEWMTEEIIHPEKMITAIYPVEKIQEAFENLERKTGKDIKTIIRF